MRYCSSRSLQLLSIVACLQLCLLFSFTNKFDRYPRYLAMKPLSMSSKYLGKEPVFVAGGSSGVGYEVIKKLSALGTPVKVLVRRESAREYLEKLPGVTVEMGDALDEAAVQKCMTGCVAAITTLGIRAIPQYIVVDFLFVIDYYHIPKVEHPKLVNWFALIMPATAML